MDSEVLRHWEFSSDVDVKWCNTENFLRIQFDMSKEQVLDTAAFDGKSVIKLNGYNDFFDSDILIPPIDSGARWCVNWWVENVEFDKNNSIKIKYYVKDYTEKSARFCTKPVISSSDYVDLGDVIISTISGLDALADFLQTKYNGSTKINMFLYVKNENDLYNKYYCKYTVDDFCTRRITGLKSTLNYK